MRKVILVGGAAMFVFFGMILCSGTPEPDALTCDELLNLSDRSPRKVRLRIELEPNGDHVTVCGGQVVMLWFAGYPLACAAGCTVEVQGFYSGELTERTSNLPYVSVLSAEVGEP